MDTITATVVGARHLRIARNGQDAAAAASGPGWAAAVVCDGCSAGAFSEVGARLGAAIVVAALARRLAEGSGAGAGGGSCGGAELWADVQADVIRALSVLADRMGPDRVQTVVDHFLFTIVAAARRPATTRPCGRSATARTRSATRTRVLGPFADNQPPYLGYDLLGDTPRRTSRSRAVRTRIVAIGTDGATELDARTLCAAEVRRASPTRCAASSRCSRARPERIDWDERARRAHAARAAGRLRDRGRARCRHEPHRVDRRHARRARPGALLGAGRRGRGLRPRRRPRRSSGGSPPSIPTSTACPTRRPPATQRLAEQPAEAARTARQPAWRGRRALRARARSRRSRSSAT